MSSGATFKLTTKWGAFSKGCPNYDGANDAGYYLDSGTTAHVGIDMDRADGQSVVAIAGGEVKVNGQPWGAENGNVVVIEHETSSGEKFIAVYGHLHSDVAALGRIEAGAQVGRVKTAGTGAHLHFGIRAGAWNGQVPPGSSASSIDGSGNCRFDARNTVDPLTYLSARAPAGTAPPDSDSDGVADGSDRCSSLRGFGAWTGCRPNLLRNGSFEEGSFAGWQKLQEPGGVTNVAVYRDRSVAREGEWYGAANTSIPAGSVYQDVGVAPSVGQSYTLSVWLRKESPGALSGRIVLWGVGGSQNLSVGESFSVGTGWELVTVTHDVKASHGFLRAQIYLDTTGQTLLFDGLQLTPSLLRNGSFEEGSFAGWQKLQEPGGVTNVAVYKDHAVARDGEWYGATNTSVSAGSVYQDIGVAPSVGQSYTFSIWLRKESAGLLSGRVVLWGVGGSQNLSVGESFSVGTDWELVTVTHDVKASHGFLRAQIYLDTTGQTLLFDGAQLTRNGLRNASFEEGSFAGWQKLQEPGGVTNVAVYKDHAVARDGEWYGATNTSVADGSVYQDIGLAPTTGESYTFSIWLRKESAGTVSGRVVLWGVGGSQNLAGTQPFSVGPEWRNVEVTNDVRASHGFLRAQIYLDTTGQTLLLDGASLAVGSNRDELRCANRPVTVDLGLRQMPTAGADVILGTERADSVDGGPGTDVICGADGGDRLVGGPGADLIFGGAGSDVVEGQAGDDRLDGGAGRDVVSYRRADGRVTVTLASRQVQPTTSDGRDRLLRFEDLTGSRFNDRLAGDEDRNTLDGLFGRDRCEGGNGRDTARACEVLVGVP